MPVKRKIHEVCPDCGERTGRLEGAWVHWTPCSCDLAVPGPPPPPRHYRITEVEFHATPISQVQETQPPGREETEPVPEGVGKTTEEEGGMSDEFLTPIDIPDGTYTGKGVSTMSYEKSIDQLEGFARSDPTVAAFVAAWKEGHISTFPEMLTRLVVQLAIEKAAKQEATG